MTAKTVLFKTLPPEQREALFSYFISNSTKFTYDPKRNCYAARLKRGGSSSPIRSPRVPSHAVSPVGITASPSLLPRAASSKAPTPSLTFAGHRASLRTPSPRSPLSRNSFVQEDGPCSPALPQGAHLAAFAKTFAVLCEDIRSPPPVDIAAHPLKAGTAVHFISSVYEEIYRHISAPGTMARADWAGRATGEPHPLLALREVDLQYYRSAADLPNLILASETLRGVQLAGLGAAGTLWAYVYALEALRRQSVFVEDFLVLLLHSARHRTELVHYYVLFEERCKAELRTLLESPATPAGSRSPRSLLCIPAKPLIGIVSAVLTARDVATDFVKRLVERHPSFLQDGLDPRVACSELLKYMLECHAHGEAWMRLLPAEDLDGAQPAIESAPGPTPRGASEHGGTPSRRLTDRINDILSRNIRKAADAGHIDDPEVDIRIRPSVGRYSTDSCGAPSAGASAAGSPPGQAADSPAAAAATTAAQPSTAALVESPGTPRLGDLRSTGSAFSVRSTGRPEPRPLLQFGSTGNTPVRQTPSPHSGPADESFSNVSTASGSMAMSRRARFLRMEELYPEGFNAVWMLEPRSFVTLAEGLSIVLPHLLDRYSRHLLHSLGPHAAVRPERVSLLRDAMASRFEAMLSVFAKLQDPAEPVALNGIDLSSFYEAYQAFMEQDAFTVQSIIDFVAASLQTDFILTAVASLDA